MGIQTNNKPQKTIQAQEFLKLKFSIDIYYQLTLRFSNSYLFKVTNPLIKSAYIIFTNIYII